MGRMINLIHKIHEVLNLVKGFEVGCDSKTAKDGKYLVEYCGERYFVKMEKVENPSANIFDDIDRLKYFD
jgi:hypothetical protein